MDYVVDADDLFSDSGSDDLTHTVCPRPENYNLRETQEPQPPERNEESSSPWAPGPRSVSYSRGPQLSVAPTSHRPRSREHLDTSLSYGFPQGRNHGSSPDPNLPVINPAQGPETSIPPAKPFFNMVERSSQRSRGSGGHDEAQLTCLESAHANPKENSVLRQKHGPQIHPDRQHIFARPRNDGHTKSMPVSQPLRKESSVASILPDDGLRSKVLADSGTLKASAPRRKRPSTVLPAKRPREPSCSGTVLEKDGSLLNLTSPLPKTCAIAPFGDLASIAAGVVSSRGGTKVKSIRSSVSAVKKAEPQHSPRAKDATGSVIAPFGAMTSSASPMSDSNSARTTRKAVSDRGSAARRTPYDVYIGASLTRKDREEEARKLAEEQQRIDDAYREQRNAERQNRRVVADEMRRVPTVSSSMRDAFQLDRVERHLFNDDQGKTMRNSLRHLRLILKDIGSDPMTENLWTIVMDDI